MGSLGTGNQCSPNMPRAAPSTCPGWEHSALLCTSPPLRERGCLLPATACEKLFFILTAPAASPGCLDRVTDPFVFPLQSAEVWGDSPFPCSPVSWAKSSAPENSPSTSPYCTPQTTQLARHSLPCVRLHPFPGPWKQLPATTAFQQNKFPGGRWQFLKALQICRCC